MSKSKSTYTVKLYAGALWVRKNETRLEPRSVAELLNQQEQRIAELETALSDLLKYMTEEETGEPYVEFTASLNKQSVGKFTRLCQQAHKILRDEVKGNT